MDHAENLQGSLENVRMCDGSGIESVHRRRGMTTPTNDGRCPVGTTTTVDSVELKSASTGSRKSG